MVVFGKAWGRAGVRCHEQWAVWAHETCVDAILGSAARGDIVCTDDGARVCKPEDVGPGSQRGAKNGHRTLWLACPHPIPRSAHGLLIST